MDKEKIEQVLENNDYENTITEMESNDDNEYFVANKPSVIDLYTLDNFTLDSLKARLESQKLFEQLNIVSIKEGIMKIRVMYKASNFILYLKIISNDHINLSQINRVLVDDDEIALASKCSKYIKTYVDAKSNFVQAYYAQLKLLYLLSDQPILIVDATQWCIYSNDYLRQFALLNIDIIDSNLYKVKYLEDGTIYTEGLERFGIKDIEMAGIEPHYIKSCASFLSQLSRYFIENGQIPNSCKVYNEVFEMPFYACLVDIENALDTLSEYAIVNPGKRDEYLNYNKLYVSVHAKFNMVDWYLNDEQVLQYLEDNTTFYTSTKHFEDEKELAQKTINSALNFLESIEDQNNLMILARNEAIDTDWYYFEAKEGKDYILKTDSDSLRVDINDILNWNYRGLTPLHAYSLK